MKISIYEPGSIVMYTYEKFLYFFSIRLHIEVHSMHHLNTLLPFFSLFFPFFSQTCHGQC